MEKLTVIIPCNTEADNIVAALESVKWADELIVVDSFSEDNTPELARQYTDKVWQRAYKGPADQKNWAIPQASHQWVLLMDADERITPALREEICTILANSPSYDAYWIPRQSYFMGQKVRYSGWQGDKVVRLIDRDKCRYDAKQVHEEIDTRGLKVATLKNKMDHFTYKDMNHFLDKMRRYSEWSAKDHLARTPKVGYYHLYIKPLARFFKHYIIQLGFLDGKVGFIISVIMAWGVFLRYVNIKEILLTKKQKM